MNRVQLHRTRRRDSARRRISRATGWSAVAGGGLAALFGVVFAQSAPAAATPVPAIDVAAPAPRPAPAAAPAAPRTHRPSSVQLQPPTRLPKPSSGGPVHVSSGTS